MGMGVQIFDAGGNLTFDSSDSLARIVGTITVTDGVSGYRDVNLWMGRPFAFFQLGSSNWGSPVIEVSNSRITWTYPYTSGGATGTIFYGYY